MDLLKTLRSFEELLFEAVSWLVFYPLTLWRILRGPLAAMDYSDREQSDSEERRYDDALSPPLREMAELRLKYPSLSLRDLGAKASVSKSTAQRRLNALVKLSRQ